VPLIYTSQQVARSILRFFRSLQNLRTTHDNKIEPIFLMSLSTHDALIVPLCFTVINASPQKAKVLQRRVLTISKWFKKNSVLLILEVCSSLSARERRGRTLK